MSIDDDGFVAFGSEITPEQVAKGKAGLPNEKRQNLGEKVIAKNLFKNIEVQATAKSKVAELGGEKASEVTLTRDEYMSFVKDNDGNFQGVPSELLADADFMKEAAKLNPYRSFQNASQSLKNDSEFIKYIYALSGKDAGMYDQLSE